MDLPSPPVRRLGVFDSGAGGLTVYAALASVLPRADLLYIGDTARVPWGTRSPHTVRSYAADMVRFLLDQGCDGIVIACHTASALAADSLREQWPGLPILDVISPTVAEIMAEHPAVVGVLGTRGTVRSGAWARALQAQASGLRVVSQACPLLVPLVEESWTEGPVVEAVIHRYLSAMPADEAPDALVLACTHYPLLRACIQRVATAYWGRPVSLHDCAGPTARACAARWPGAGGEGPVGLRQAWATDAPQELRAWLTRLMPEGACVPVEAADVAGA
jgi:glutamate racemase